MQIYTCDVIIDLQSYLSRGFMSLSLSLPPPSFFQGTHKPQYFLLNPLGQGPITPLLR